MVCMQYVSISVYMCLCKGLRVGVVYATYAIRVGFCAFFVCLLSSCPDFSLYSPSLSLRFGFCRLLGFWIRLGHTCVRADLLA